MSYTSRSHARLADRNGVHVNGEHIVATSQMSVRISSDGEIVSIRHGGKKKWQAIKGRTTLAGCRIDRAVQVMKNPDGSLTFRKHFVHDSLQRSSTLVERFVPTLGSVRWEIEISGDDLPWSTAIRTDLEYPVTASSRFWTAWAAPQYDSTQLDQATRRLLRPFPSGSEEMLAMPGGKLGSQWIDPLVPIPFSDAVYYYGAPYYKAEQPRDGFIPFPGNLFCIPLSTVLDQSAGTGMTCALSPEDDLIDMVLKTGRNGTISFERLFNRIEKNKVVRFSVDLVPHEDDWRPALAWMANRFPHYFKPSVENASQLAGTGAYSSDLSMKFDAGRMKKMGFSTNWQASFDFPYMGMFLPPVGKNERWKRFGKDSVSIAEMDRYAASMRTAGFCVLNYFNVTEFGTKIRNQRPDTEAIPENDLWRESNRYLFQKFPSAILRKPQSAGPSGEGRPWATWEGAVAMDCGDAAYRSFLLNQAERHVRELPSSFGICIDRLDWLRMYNDQADDGKTWFEGKPARSLIHSFKTLMSDLGPIFHRNGKYILANNHTKRLDILDQIDGLFDEFTYAGSPLNTTAFLCINKPALGWTDAVSTIRREGGDAFFQKYLYMGVSPMCPFPGNDHSLRPDTLTDRLYLDYGPLLNRIKTREWVLNAHSVSVENNMARANLFRVRAGYAIPVVYGQAKRVTLLVNHPEWAGKKLTVQVCHPGFDEEMSVTYTEKKGKIRLDVPLSRGCAMVMISAW